MTMAPRVSYRHLPHKSQLSLLMLARVAEPLVATSIQSCMFFQLRHFSPSASDATISTQAGLLVSSKTAAHVCTGVIWGRFADHRRCGRKPVLVLGLLASAVGVLGYGYSQSFASAIAWQLVDGALNSSISMVRCMTAEMYPEKSHRARALTLLPLSACAGMFLGPILGGFLASDFHGSQVRTSLSQYPFAMPSLLLSIYCIFTALLVLLVLEDQQGDEPVNRRPWSWSFHGLRMVLGYEEQSKRKVTNISTHESDPLLASTTSCVAASGLCPDETAVSEQPTIQSKPNVLPFRKMWTANVVSTMLATFLIAGQLGSFTSLWPLFLSAPSQPSNHHFGPLHLAGGLAMDRRQVAVSMSLLGLVGVFLQVVVYPALNDRFGTIRIWRSGLWLFPVAFFVAPLATLTVGPQSNPSSATEGGAVSWFAALFVLLLFTAGRTCVTPATSLLINDCTPHPSVRGTIHTAGTVAGNLGRSIFPAIILPVFGYGLQTGVTGIGFWCLAVLATLTCAMRGLVTEGSNGKDIVLEDDPSVTIEVGPSAHPEITNVKKRPVVSIHRVDSNC